MGPNQRTPASNSEFMMRLAVTLGVLAVYRLGIHLPLAGTDLVKVLGSQTSDTALAAERISVFALGVTPIISVMLLVEVARLLSRDFNESVYATRTNARRLDHYVLIGALLLATAQGYGIAKAIEPMGDLVAEPGLQFRLTIMVTFVASTAMIVWLAALISRNGLGSGLWILLLASHLAGLPGWALQVFDAVQAGFLPEISLVATVACILIALVSITVLARTLDGMGMPLDRALIWPLYIAAWMAGTLTMVPLLVPSGAMRDMAAALLNRGAPLYLAALAVFVFVISLAQWRRAKAHLTAADPSSPAGDASGELPIILTALILAIVTVAPEILATYFSVPVLIDARLITVMVLVALPIQDLLRGRQA
jgi:preprotein translocase subunit SecY